MPRRSLAKERRQQILDAFEQCITRYGLEGTTLEQVADEANMSRSIIRHYIGNRDSVVEELVKRRLKQTTDALIKQYEGLSPEDSVKLTLSTMFTENPVINEGDQILLDVMTTGKDRYSGARQRLRKAFEEIIQSFTDDLRLVYTSATYEQCRQVAYAIICLAEMNESFMWLGINRKYNADARVIADTLLATLE